MLEKRFNALRRQPTEPITTPEQTEALTVVIEQALQVMPESDQRAVVHDLLQSQVPEQRALAQTAWEKMCAVAGKAATFAPGFELTVFKTMMQNLTVALRSRAARGTALALTAFIVERYSAVEFPTVIPTAEAASLEAAEQEQYGARQAYSALLDIAAFLHVEIPTYKEATEGDVEASFAQAHGIIRQHITAVAGGDQEYERVLILRAANKGLTPPVFQPPFTTLADWLSSDTLTPERMQYTPGVTSLDDFKTSLKSKDEAHIAEVIDNLYFHSDYNTVLDTLLQVIQERQVSPRLQQAIALKVASHQRVDGSNSIRYFYQELQQTDLAHDHTVQRAFELAFQEVRAEHDAFRYEHLTPLQVPHLRTAGQLSSQVELVVHPFYDLSQLRDFKLSDGTPPRPDFVDSHSAKQVIEGDTWNTFSKGIRDKQIPALLHGIDLMEEYLEFTQPVADAIYVVVIPKLEVPANSLAAETKQRWATQNAHILNAFYEQVGPGKMFYVESQTGGSGYLFPEDIEILVGQNPHTRYTVSGESPKRCVSNAISDLPAEWLQPDAAGLSIDDRELDDFLAQDPAFKAEMHTMAQAITQAYQAQPPQNFAELVQFYQAHETDFKAYQDFAEKLFQPTLNRHGTALEMGLSTPSR